jgi:branched-chain amino acid transport system substrate-binding protein
MKEVLEYAKKVNPDVPLPKRDIRTVQAWLKVGMAASALKIADKKGKLDGPAIKDALESFKDWQAFDVPNALGRQPYTITAKDHRPSSISSIYVIKGGKFELLEQIDMKKDFPDKWDSWLGW